MKEKIILLIPIYNPNHRVMDFLAQFKREDFFSIVIVNDGSANTYSPIFEQIEQLNGFEVINYPQNHGKGYALKTGIEYIKTNYPDAFGLVTCDGDGQHAYQDVLQVRNALKEDCLIMGVRNFSKEICPAKNRFGNSVSSLYYRLYTHKNLKDTQTGLRGIPASLFSLALQTRGNRYDFEMNFLLEAAKSYPVVEIPIETIYDPESVKESHFNPFIDSMRIFKTPILYVLVAILSFAIDALCFYLLFTYAFGSLEINKVTNEFFSVILARLVSGSFNFVLYFFVVFPSRGNHGQKILRYLLLFLLNMGLSFAFTALCTYLGDIIESWAVTLIKVVVDFAIAIANFFINWLWVFAKKNRQKKGLKND